MSYLRTMHRDIKQMTIERTVRSMFNNWLTLSLEKKMNVHSKDFTVRKLEKKAFKLLKQNRMVK